MIDIPAALSELVVAYETPHPRTGHREPILYIRYLGGSHLQHHALEDAQFDPDETLLEQLHLMSLIVIDYRDNSWAISTTARAQKLVETYERGRATTTPSAVAAIAAAVETQSQAENPLSWASVRPVLLSIRRYWQDSGYPEHGVNFAPITECLPDESLRLFLVTMRQLTRDGYLDPQIDELKIDEGAPLEADLSEKAMQVLDGWPGISEDLLAENLVAAIVTAAKEEPNPDTKSKLERLGDAASDIGTRTLSEVLSKILLGTAV